MSNRLNLSAASIVFARRFLDRRFRVAPPKDLTRISIGPEISKTEEKNKMQYIMAL